MRNPRHALSRGFTGLFEENQSTSLEKLDAAYEGEDPLVQRLQQRLTNWTAALSATSFPQLISDLNF